MPQPFFCWAKCCVRSFPPFQINVSRLLSSVPITLALLACGLLCSMSLRFASSPPPEGSLHTTWAPVVLQSILILLIGRRLLPWEGSSGQQLIGLHIPFILNLKTLFSIELEVEQHREIVPKGVLFLREAEGVAGRGKQTLVRN